jgi:transposase
MHRELPMFAPVSPATLAELQNLSHGELVGRVVSLLDCVARLTERVKELEAQVAKNSGNSSKPPSSDGLNKKPAPAPTGKPGGRKRGGQRGHPGSTLQQVSEPDEVVLHPLPELCDCGRPLHPVVAEIRQVFDIPPVSLQVTEHQTFKARCACGRCHRSAFPAEVAAPVQYGPAVKGLAVLLTQHHMMPFERTAELLSGLLGLTLSPATIEAFVIEAATRLSPTAGAIAAAVTVAPVINVDETGLRVAGKLKWLHVAVTQALAWMGVHDKRGIEAMTAFAILPEVTGVLVHDGWKPYETLAQCGHALCNAHILRDLTFIHEVYEQAWAKRMVDFLLSANETVRQAAGQALPQNQQLELREVYDRLVAEGWAANPPTPLLLTPRKGPPKKTPAENLLNRLQRQADQVLHFLRNPAVPFTNNLAERTVRMPKVKQKVAGCFRTLPGAQRFCTIRTYLVTLAKQGQNLLDALVSTMRGAVPQPDLSPG